MRIGYSKESIVGDIKYIENVTVDIEDRVELLYDTNKGFKNLNNLVSEIKDSLGSDVEVGMKVIYKKEKSIIEQIDEAIVNASMYNKKIDKIVLTKEEFERVGNQLFAVDDYTYAYKNIVIELDEDEREDISEDGVDEDFISGLLDIYEKFGLLPPKESK